MTPDTITKATEALARDVLTRSAARDAGAELGRTIAAQIKAREIATEQLNSGAVIAIELTLLRLAACSNDAVADVADSALQAMRGGERAARSWPEGTVDDFP